MDDDDDGGGGGAVGRLLVGTTDGIVMTVSGHSAAMQPPSPCVKLWRLRSQLRRNSLPQLLQLYGLMSVWVRRWVFRLLRWLKVLPQVVHL